MDSAAGLGPLETSALFAPTPSQGRTLTDCLVISPLFTFIIHSMGGQIFAPSPLPLFITGVIGSCRVVGVQFFLWFPELLLVRNYKRVFHIQGHLEIVYTHVITFDGIVNF